MPSSLKELAPDSVASSVHLHCESRAAALQNDCDERQQRGRQADVEEEKAAKIPALVPIGGAPFFWVGNEGHYPSPQHSNHHRRSGIVSFTQQDPEVALSQGDASLTPPFQFRDGGAALIGSLHS